MDFIQKYFQRDRAHYFTKAYMHQVIHLDMARKKQLTVQEKVVALRNALIIAFRSRGMHEGEAMSAVRSLHDGELRELVHRGHADPFKLEDTAIRKAFEFVQRRRANRTPAPKPVKKVEPRSPQRIVPMAHPSRRRNASTRPRI